MRSISKFSINKSETRYLKFRSIGVFCSIIFCNALSNNVTTYPILPLHDTASVVVVLYDKAIKTVFSALEVAIDTGEVIFDVESSLAGPQRLR